MEIKDCLVIAGKAHRQVLSLQTTIAANQESYPNGPENCALSTEIALCETIISGVRGLLVQHRLELVLEPTGRAKAHVPDRLRSTEYDEGTHYEKIE